MWFVLQNCFCQSTKWRLNTRCCKLHYSRKWMPKCGIILFLVSAKWTVLAVSLWEMLKRKLKREHFIFKSKVKTQIKYLHSNFMQCITVESTDLIYVSKISIQKTHPFQFTENSDMRRASKQICIIYKIHSHYESSHNHWQIRFVNWKIFVRFQFHRTFI